MNSCLGPPEVDGAAERLRNGPRIILRAFEWTSRPAYLNRNSPFARIIIRLVSGRSDCIIMTVALRTSANRRVTSRAARRTVDLTRGPGTANKTLVVFEPKRL